MGMPVSLAQRYYEEGADEVTFLNITGFRDCPLTDLPMLKVRARVRVRVRVRVSLPMLKVTQGKP